MNTFLLLLLNALPDHFVRKISSAHGKISPRPKETPPELPPQAVELLKEHPRTDPFSAAARSCSHSCAACSPPERECGRLPLSPTISSTRAPSRSAGSEHAHEAPPPPLAPSCDISVSTPDVPSNRVSCARPVGIASRDHITRLCASPEGQGFPPSPKETLTGEGIHHPAKQQGDANK